MESVIHQSIIFLGLVSAAAWVYLLLGRGFFWLEQPMAAPADSPCSPPVVAIVPARNEATTIDAVVRGLLAQDYPGTFRIVLVDDHSTDGTTEVAVGAAKSAGAAERFAAVSAPPLPSGWSGKLWAIHTGCDYACQRWPETVYLLLTDADILHPKYNLRGLVARAERSSVSGHSLVLVSLMARLSCRTIAEKLTIPAFVFFFEMLYPFSWVRDPRRRTAGAAGGVMLVQRSALERTGGIQVIRGALIDDCSLAAVLKRQGPIWLGLSRDTVSLRPHSGIKSIWKMIARTAFTQLGHSMLLLAGTLAGLSVVYLVPPLLLASSSRCAAALGALAWIMMTLAYWPTVFLYRLNPLWTAALPLTTLIYAGATVDSARRYWLGRGGEWKGRAQA